MKNQYDIVRGRNSCCERDSDNDQSGSQRDYLPKCDKAYKATRALRNALKPEAIIYSKEFHHRLLTLMKEISSSAGENLDDHRGLDRLSQFEFNCHGHLRDRFTAPFNVDISRTTGELKLEIPSFASNVVLRSMFPASHFRFVVTGAAIDFVSERSDTSTVVSSFFSLDDTRDTATSLSVFIRPDSPRPLVLSFGIVFYHLVNNKKYPLRSLCTNAMAIVAIDTP